MIRRAESKDFDAIMALGRELHEKIGGLPEIDDRGCRMLLAGSLAHKRRLILVSERNGVITGFMFCMVEELFYSKAKYASDVILYANDGFSGALMVRRFMRWAKTMSVAQIQLGVSSGLNVDRLERLYQKLGLAKAGALFIGRPV